MRFLKNRKEKNMSPITLLTLRALINAKLARFFVTRRAADFPSDAEVQLARKRALVERFRARLSAGIPKSE